MPVPLILITVAAVFGAGYFVFTGPREGGDGTSSPDSTEATTMSPVQTGRSDQSGAVATTAMAAADPSPPAAPAAPAGPATFATDPVPASDTDADSDPARGLTPIARARAATALIGSTGHDATAFCVSRHGTFVTSLENVTGVPIKATVPLWLNSGTDNERLCRATLVLRDPEAQVAVLHVEGGGDQFIWLELVEASRSVDGTRVTLLGFPFGQALAEGNDSNPAVSVNIGTASWSDPEKDLVERITIDAQLNPGNNGGPVMNREGRVVGILTGPVENDLVKFAVPADELRRVLRTPEIQLHFARYRSSIPVDELPLERTYDATVRPLPGMPAENYTARLIIEAHRRHSPGVTVYRDPASFLFSHTTSMSRSGDQFSATAPFVLPADGRLPFRGTTAKSMIMGLMPDLEIELAGNMYRLGQVRSLSLSPSGECRIQLREDGRIESGRLAADVLSRVAIERPGQPDAVVDLNTARTLIFPVPDDIVSLSMIVQVLASDGTELGRREARVSVKHSPDWKPPPDFLGPLLPDAQTEGTGTIVELPGKIVDVCFGGSGRYVICSIPEAQQLVVIDITQPDVLRSVPLTADGALVTAGWRDLLIGFPRKNLIERYDLASLEQTQTAKLELADPMVELSLGAGSAGPALVAAGKFPAFGLLDMTTLACTELQLPADASGRPVRLLRTQSSGTSGTVRAAASGSYWRFGQDAGLRSVDGGLECIPNRIAWPAFPSPDGQLLYTRNGPVPINGQPERGKSSSIFFPSVHGDLYVQVPSDRTPSECFVFIAGQSRPVATLSAGSRVFAESLKWTPHTLAEKRLVLAPAFDRMVLTFPDRIEVLPFQLKNVLKAGQHQYLVPVSVPVPVATAGATYRYQIRVVSASENIQYRLETGPSGLKVDNAGMVSWTPADSDRGQSSMIAIRISDSDGLQWLHQFPIVVE